MRQTDYTTRVLEAEPGRFLTQAADIPDTERVVTPRVYLAANDSPEAWREITAAEAGAIEAARSKEPEDANGHGEGD